MDGQEKNLFRKNIKKYANLDSRFLFVNSGYNLRPTEIQAAIALSQLNEKIFLKITEHTIEN